MSVPFVVHPVIIHINSFSYISCIHALLDCNNDLVIWKGCSVVEHHGATFPEIGYDYYLALRTPDNVEPARGPVF